MPRPVFFVHPFVVAVVALALAPGCRTGGEGAQPSRHVRTDVAGAVPSDVEFYGHVLYGGDDAYLVEGRWYRPELLGWVVFTEEPLELELFRRALEASGPDRSEP